MKTGLVISTTDSEILWNAFRFGCFAAERGDQVRAFLLGPGVEAEQRDTDQFPVSNQMQRFVDLGGQILACGTCLKIRNAGGSDLCPISTMADLYALVHECERVLSF
ncbi:MAG: DsrE family protein [Spirochaetales bacterium]|nr:DsrE family protein [Spirochaetales bacterium]